MSADIGDTLREAVEAAAINGTVLKIVGGGTKEFYGRKINGQPLQISGHHGIVSYEPTELVITVRAGTKLREVEATLAEKNQMLAFEPPYFGEDATIGGTIACGLSGPRRPFAGAARDFVLGTKILNGKGEVLSFGGQVMKNVAGYDVSRLMAGSGGTLAVLLEISLKVLPKPEVETTVALPIAMSDAPKSMSHWAVQPLPMSGACCVDELLNIRVSGSEGAVKAACSRLSGERVPNSEEFWRDLREQRLDFFSNDLPLWRLSIPPATPHMDLPGDWIIDWGGAQRWLKSDAPANEIWRAAEQVGGHATLFRGGDRSGEVFQPLAPELAKLHQDLKQAFDPTGMFNRHRLYRDW
jgi:glycolate oxidase FAD binding subunit